MFSQSLPILQPTHESRGSTNEGRQRPSMLWRRVVPCEHVFRGAQDQPTTPSLNITPYRRFVLYLVGASFHVGPGLGRVQNHVVSQIRLGGRWGLDVMASAEAPSLHRTPYFDAEWHASSVCVGNTPRRVECSAQCCCSLSRRC